MLLYSRNECTIVKLLYFNKDVKKKNYIKNVLDKTNKRHEHNILRMKDTNGQ